MRKKTHLILKRHVPGPLQLTEVSHGPKIFGTAILHSEETVEQLLRFFFAFLTEYSIYLYKMFGVLKCQLFVLDGEIIQFY